MSKILRCDLHTHTNYSFDSKSPMLQYLQKALDIGMDAICFTDHIDANRHYNTFEGFQFERRREEFDRLRDQYCDRIKLLYGFEIGEPHLHPEIMDRVYAANPDMIIGSIHNPLDYCKLDYTPTRRDYEKIYNEFARKMVEHGGFDVVGHLDMLKKYHDDFVDDYDYVAETLRLCVDKGLVPEINTSSMRSCSKDPMPSLKAIEHYAKCGGKFVTIDSDSHEPRTLCYAFDEIRSQLPQGVSACYFEKSKIVKFDD